MDYIKWSQEYLDEADKIQRIIDNRKKLLSKATHDQRQCINADIIKLKAIYYECKLTARHLIERAGVSSYAA